MSPRISKLFDFNPYSAGFVPVADVVLNPHEARSVDSLMRRTILARKTYGHLADAEVVHLARQARNAYISEALPHWWHAVKVGSGAAVRVTVEAIPAAVRWVQRGLEQLEATRRERYLSDSADVQDLERRMRTLERTSVRGTY